MLNEKSISLLDGSLKRIFAMKLSRSTFREVQNIVFKVAAGDREFVTDIFEALFTGNIKPSLTNDSLVQDHMKEICKNYTILVRLAKEIYERGDFVNMVTSDLVTQENEVAFLNRIQRIDGEEFMFITDPASCVHLLQHFFARLQELEQNEIGRDSLHAFKKDLVNLSSRINALAADLTEVSKG